MCDGIPRTRPPPANSPRDLDALRRPESGLRQMKYVPWKAVLNKLQQGKEESAQASTTK